MGLEKGETSLEGYKNMFLFSYNTLHLLKKDKVRFYYALKGRDGKSGVVESYDINHLGRTVLMVPEIHSQDVRDFLALWECHFDEKEVMLKL